MLYHKVVDSTKNIFLLYKDFNHNINFIIFLLFDEIRKISDIYKNNRLNNDFYNIKNLLNKTLFLYFFWWINTFKYHIIPIIAII